MEEKKANVTAVGGERMRGGNDYCCSTLGPCDAERNNKKKGTP